ncbi:MAG TPA: head GIN domain-containing protein [Termitinemataceae bacterium]|nr:head GIN domain-containing protein [Termitinemataceae bacterium]HOM23145.1 head GIN domain-containing protein [Termitinemataceae bacterium]HPQ00332.1 head GIN domain-containing protein [Termitinemataceae bacterium]
MKKVIAYGLLLVGLITVGSTFYGLTRRSPSQKGGTLQLPSFFSVQNERELSGEIVEVQKELSPFSQVSIPGAGRVVFRKGDAWAVTIRADKNLIDALDTRVEGRTLVLGQQKNFLFLKNAPIEYVITTPKLEKLSIAGMAEVRGDSTLEGPSFLLELAGSGTVSLPVNVEELQLKVLGSGTVEISGAVEKLEYQLLGSGTLKAQNLSGKEGHISVLGAGNSDLGVFEELDITIAGSGTVTYSGNPRIKSRIPGTGTIRSR